MDYDGLTPLEYSIVMTFSVAQEPHNRRSSSASRPFTDHMNLLSRAGPPKSKALQMIRIFQVNGFTQYLNPRGFVKVAIIDIVSSLCIYLNGSRVWRCVILIQVHNQILTKVAERVT